MHGDLRVSLIGPVIFVPYCSTTVRVWYSLRRLLSCMLARVHLQRVHGYWHVLQPDLCHDVAPWVMQPNLLAATIFTSAVALLTFFVLVPMINLVTGVNVYGGLLLEDRRAIPDRAVFSFA